MVERRIRRSRRLAVLPGALTVAAVIAALALVPLVGRLQRPGPAPAPAVATVAGVTRVTDPARALRAIGQRVGGDPVEAVRWTDARGRNLVVLSAWTRAGTPSRDTVPPSPTTTRRLEAIHFVTGGGTTTRVETIRDGVDDCAHDVSAGFRPGSLGVTDADADGTGEVTFAYLLNCTGDVGAGTLKLLVLEGGTKRIVRGRSYAAPGDGAGLPPIAAPRPEPAWAAWPPPLRRHARAQWSRWAIVR